jgi:hypothetical protein
MITYFMYTLKYRYKFIVDYKGSSQLEDIKPDKPGLIKLLQNGVRYFYQRNKWFKNYAHVVIQLQYILIIKKDEIDMILGLNMLFEGRSRLVDFPYPILKTVGSIMMSVDRHHHENEQESNRLLAILKPFQSQVWEKI